MVSISEMIMMLVVDQAASSISLNRGQVDSGTTGIKRLYRGYIEGIQREYRGYIESI